MEFKRATLSDRPPAWSPYYPTKQVRIPDKLNFSQPKMLHQPCHDHDRPTDPAALDQNLKRF